MASRWTPMTWGTEGRACAICHESIEHRGPKALYCGDVCRYRARALKEGPGPERPTAAICRLANCGKKVASGGRCSGHNHRAVRYGLTDEEMATLDAGVPCEICEDLATHVDHCHEAGWGTKRGFLCRACNLALGYFRDRPELLERAATYLRDAR